MALESAVTAASGVGDDERTMLDRAIEDLRAGAARWQRASLQERAALLRRTHDSIGRSSNRWALTAVGVKRLDAGSALVGEEWLSGPYAVLSGAARLATSLEALAAGRSPLDGLRFHPAPGGRQAVDVMPLDLAETLLLSGFSAEVWLRPGTTVDQARGAAGLGARRSEVSGGVGLVLGAGNITSIPPLDALYELVANNRAVLLKLNPVMAGMMTSYLDALDPLIRFGVLRIVQGGAEIGSYLAQHPGVAHVHITGSALSHDAIVWGVGEDAARRRAENAPLLAKPITSELGGVSPVIVVPGEWTEQDLRFQAEHVATQRLHNGGYNCIASQVVIVSSDWAQKAAFLEHLRRAIDEAPRRADWYPGSADRSAAAAAAYPGAERLGPDGNRLLIRTVPDDADTLASTEYFAPVLGVIELPGTGRTFLDAAIRFADEDLVGDLGANVLIRPEDRRALGAGFGRAIEALHYGTVAINAWTGLGFLLAAAPWGAYPGNSLADVGSGIGVVHNALLIDQPERTIVKGPFRPFPRSVLAGERALSPTPPWFVTARTAATTGRLLSDFTAKPSLRRMPGIFISAFRG
jgi:acyl-CoA reductase-like NAD-dependent aldehyde dehydrogenase